MLRKLKNTLMTAAGLAILLTPAMVPAMAHAATGITSTDIQNNLCSGSNVNLDTTTPNTAGCESTNNEANTKLSGILTTIINLFSVIVGVVAVIMIIFGGLRYIISGGDSSNISGAKNTIIFALVGLIIVALAQVLVHFVLSRVGGP